MAVTLLGDAGPANARAAKRAGIRTAGRSPGIAAGYAIAPSLPERGVPSGMHPAMRNPRIRGMQARKPAVLRGQPLLRGGGSDPGRPERRKTHLHRRRPPGSLRRQQTEKSGDGSPGARTRLLSPNWFGVETSEGGGRNSRRSVWSPVKQVVRSSTLKPNTPGQRSREA